MSVSKDYMIEFIMNELGMTEDGAKRVYENSSIIEASAFNEIMTSDGLDPDYEAMKYEYYNVYGCDYLIEWELK